MKHWHFSFICLSLFIFSSALLITGSDWLLYPLWEDPYFPFGTLMTWIGMISLPLFIYSGFRILREDVHPFLQALRNLIRASILLSISWGVLCYLLAGNWSYSFGQGSSFVGSDMAGKTFWYLNYLTVGLPVVILFVFLFYLLIRWIQSRILG